jgi:methionyl-tRNA synthetase
MNRRILIGGAWPYGNYFLHIGHLAALLPGDILARYFRQNGDSVLYVSGTDAHGTPITERARKENVEPEVVANRYHEQDVKDFEDMGFTYDNYGATFMDWHKEEVGKIFLKIHENGYLYDKITDQVFCEKCNKFLSDREIGGNCPHCGKETKGDQCDSCLASFDPKDLTDKKCLICSSETVLKSNKELVFALSKFQESLEKYFESMRKEWRTNAENETSKYLSQGVPDRDATRNITWGIKVPFEGYEDKRIYVWLEAVLGYLTSGRFAANKYGIDFDEFMTDDENLETYYIHGKDNIPFHTVIFPALLLAYNPKIQLPKHIISSEYVNMGKDKMSKSAGNLVSIRDLLDEFETDTIRFFFIVNNPERRDVAYNRDDLIAHHNKFLVGGFGNFVNRNLSFLIKKFDGKIPQGEVDNEIKELTVSLYKTMGQKFEKGELRSAAEDMLSYIQTANKYYDEKQPWIQVKSENQTDFNNTTATCLYIMANMSNLFYPVIPFGCEKLRKMLELPEKTVWNEENISISQLGEINILYDRIV